MKNFTALNTLEMRFKNLDFSDSDIFDKLNKILKLKYSTLVSLNLDFGDCGNRLSAFAMEDIISTIISIPNLTNLILNFKACSLIGDNSLS